MKISQLVATKTKTLYHESVASRLPRGIKTQQQLLNLGYRVAVEDLGLAKAKTLNENFAAKLVNSYHRQSLNEGVGSFLGRAAGNVTGAIGAAGRGLSNAWKDAKQGYKDAKGAWDENPPTPAGTGAAPADGGGGAPAGGGADRPYVAPAGGGATGAAGAGGIGDIMKAIDSLDPASKKQLAGELDKSINTPPAAAPAMTGGPTAGLPPAPGAAPAAPGAAPAPQGQSLDLDQLKKDREAKLAAGQAGQQQAQQQMASTAQANAATNQQDAAIKAASDAAKAKSGFQQTAADKLAIKAAAAKGIREEDEEDEIAEGFHSNFLGMKI